MDRLTAAHTDVTGGKPAVWGAAYGSDLRLLTGLGGIPTVQYGPGDVGHITRRTNACRSARSPRPLTPSPPSP